MFKQSQLPPTWARPSAPLFMHLLITRACNWACPFCVIKKEKAKHGDLGQIQEVVGKLAEAGVLDVTLFGGEPLIHPHALHIGRTIIEKGMKPGFVSNGDVDVDPVEVAEIFPQGSVSIHGQPEIHDSLVGQQGSFDRSVHFLKKYIQAGGRASVCVTVGKKNLAGFQDFCTYISNSLQVVSIVVNPVIPFPLASDALDTTDLTVFGRVLATVAESLEHKGIQLTLGASVPFCALPQEAAHLNCACYAGTLFATVDYTGSLFVCAERDTPIGNIFQTDLASLWNHYGEFEEQSSGIFADPSCQRCVAYSWCIGGCRSTRGGKCSTTDIRSSGPEDAKRNLCFIEQKFNNPSTTISVLNAVSLASGVRFRRESFGMFILNPQGQPLAIDNIGSRLFEHFTTQNMVTCKNLSQVGCISEADAIAFIGQGIRLGVLTERN